MLYKLVQFVRTELYRILKIHVVLIRLGVFHTQHIMVNNSTWHILLQSDVDKKLTQNLKRIKFHFLRTTNVKKTICHITILVKLSNYNISVLLKAISTKGEITHSGIKVTW